MGIDIRESRNSEYNVFKPEQPLMTEAQDSVASYASAVGQQERKDTDGG